MTDTYDPTFDSGGTEWGPMPDNPHSDKKFTQSDLDAALTLFAGQAAQHHYVRLERSSDDPHYVISKGGCSCGKLVADGVTPWKDLWREHILALVPNPNALAEHDAAIKQQGVEEGFAIQEAAIDQKDAEIDRLRAQIASAEAKAYRRCADAPAWPAANLKKLFEQWADEAEAEQQAEAKEGK